MRYRLLGVDLDGTLLQRDGSVSAADLEAIVAAQAAGCLVVPCTGRGWRESRVPLRVVEGLGPGVFNTGAAVMDLRTGHGIDTAVMEPGLVLELIEFLRPLPQAVMVYMDHNRAGVDFVVSGDGKILPKADAWFEANDIRWREVREPTAEDVHHALRVGLVAEGEEALRLEEKLMSNFRGRVHVHAFAGVPTASKDDYIYIAEVFAAGVNKWRGLTVLADKQGIPHDRIAGIGDEINDLAMLEHAACGVAMANAVERAKAVADYEAGSVAEAIGKMLEGAW
ncbi:MAG: HAD hydrolase family protein [Planctomycetota bacterium]